jgi:serine/threonine-protein kinase
MTDAERLAAALADGYRLEREIGQGGMATVWLAHDLKHERTVALKVLRPELAAILGRERFLAEIRIAAKLDHPHILTLLDSGETDGFLWYSLPFVRGESLRQRLARERQLDVAEAVDIARQVAGALEHAHRQGVIHRDVKPENILLHEGEAMLADFGIALAVREAGEQRLTATGLSLGTPRYMSPEQATAEWQLDARSDVYSLGVVLYEMLSGETPFGGATPQAVIARLLTERPTPLRTLRDAVPARVEAAVGKALAKLPADRFPSATAFAVALGTEALDGAVEPPAAAGAGRRAFLRAALAAAVLLALVVAGWRLRRTDRPVSLGTVRSLTLEPGLERWPAVSPDGRYVAYAAGRPSRIFLRQPGSRPVQLVTPDTGPPQYHPVWSPDGSRILFESPAGIFVIPALGGAPRLVATNGWSATWAPDARRIAFARGDTILAVDVEAGSTTRLATVKEPAELAWSPDGRWIALSSGNDAWSVNGNLAQSRLMLVDARSGRVTPLTDRSAMNVGPAWMPDSRGLLFVSNRGGGRDIHVMHIDRAGRPVGETTRLSTGLAAASISLSASGDRIAYATYHPRVNIWSVPIPPSGSVGVSSATPLTTGNQSIEAIALSEDRRWLYFTSDRSGNSDIYRLPLTGGEPEQLTTDPADDFGPAPSPDGAWLAFYSLRAGTRDIWLMPLGTGEAVRLTDDPGEEFMPLWSPDGQRICYGQDNTESGNGTRLIQRRGEGWSTPTLVAYQPRVAPPGCSDWMPDGTSMFIPQVQEITLVSPDGGPPRVFHRIDTARGETTVPSYWWKSPDGRTVFFRAVDGGLWAKPLAGGAPREVVRWDDPGRRSTRGEWDTDGKRFYFSLADPQMDIFVADIIGLD